MEEIKSNTAGIYKIIKGEYFSGIKGRQLFNASEINFAALQAIIGVKQICYGGLSKLIYRDWTLPNLLLLPI